MVSMYAYIQGSTAKQIDPTLVFILSKQHKPMIKRKLIWILKGHISYVWLIVTWMIMRKNSTTEVFGLIINLEKNGNHFNKNRRTHSSNTPWE